MNDIHTIADRVEACGFTLAVLPTFADQLRRGEINLMTLGNVKREVSRLNEALRALDTLIAKEQGR